MRKITTFRTAWVPKKIPLCPNCNFDMEKKSCKGNKTLYVCKVCEFKGEIEE